MSDNGFAVRDEWSWWPLSLGRLVGTARDPSRKDRAGSSRAESSPRADAPNAEGGSDLAAIPGIGILGATALVAFIGDVHRFPTARHFASYLGLTPSERSSGERRLLGRISKQGDRYLRTLLIQGARALISATKQFGNTDQVRDWALRLEQRRNRKKANVGLANKLARIVWAVWRIDGAVYEAKPVAA